MPKTPDEIKKGLECCKEDECFGERENCPYTADPKLCVGVMCADALAYISQLESQNRCFKEIKESCEKRMIEMAQRMPHWTSVDDECPDSKLKVLAIVYEDMYDMGEIKPCPAVHTAYTRGEDEGWFDWYTGDWLHVTHWMPLPEPPKEENNNGKQ